MICARPGCGFEATDGDRCGACAVEHLRAELARVTAERDEAAKALARRDEEYLSLCQRSDARGFEFRAAVAESHRAKGDADALRSALAVSRRETGEEESRALRAEQERDALVAAQPDYAVRVVALTTAVREYLAAHDAHERAAGGGQSEAGAWVESARRIIATTETLRALAKGGAS